MNKIILSNQTFWSWFTPPPKNKKKSIESYLGYFGDNQLDKDYIIELSRDLSSKPSEMMKKLAISVPRKYFLEMQFCAMAYGKFFSQVFPPLANHVDQLTYIEWLLYMEPENMRYKDHLVHMFKVAFVGDQLLDDTFLDKIVELQFKSSHFNDWLQTENLLVKESDKKTIIKMAFFMASIFHDFGYGYYLLRKLNDKVSKINEWHIATSDILDVNSPFAQFLYKSLPASFIEGSHEWFNKGKPKKKKGHFKNNIISGFFHDCLPLNHSIASCFFILDMANKLKKARALKDPLYIAFQLAAEAAMLHDMTNDKNWMHLHQEKNVGHFLDKNTQESVPLAMLLILADELSIWNRPRIEPKVELNSVRYSMKAPVEDSNIELSLNDNTIEISSTPEEWVGDIEKEFKKMDFFKSKGKSGVIEVLGYQVNTNV